MQDSRLAQARRLLLPSPAAAFRSMDLRPREALDRTGNLFRRAFAPEQADPRVLAAEGPAERFKVALFLAGRGERDLPTIERHSGALFETYAMLTIVAAVWLLVAPGLGLGGGSGWRGVDLFFPAAFTLLLATKTFAHSLALYRIQRRAMVPVREFLRDPNAWLGGKPRLGMLLLALCAGSALGALAPAPALAQGAVQSTGAALNLLTTAAGAEDLSLEWLRTLFPGMADMACPSGGTCTPSTGDALSAMFGTLNAVLLGVGSLVLGWHTLAGTVAAAHEGKVMGQKYHLMWAPVRVILGFGLLVPIRGYCGAQFAMIMVLVWGYNLANGLWSTYVDAALSGRMASVASSTAPQMGMRLAQAVVASETCVAVLDGWRDGVNGSANGLQRMAIRAGLYSTGIPATKVPDPAGEPGQPDVNLGRIANLRLASALTPTVLWDYGAACGTVRANANDNPANELGSTLAGGANAALGSVGSTVNTGGTSAFARDSNTAYQAFVAERNKAVTQLITSVRAAGLHTAVASTVLEGRNLLPPGTDRGTDAQQRYGKVLQAGVVFDDAVTRAAGTLVEALNKNGSAQFKERAKALGWASAGALNSTLVRASARAMELVGNAAPMASGPDMTQLRGAVDNAATGEYRGKLEQGMGYLGHIVRDTAARGQSTPSSVTMGADMEGRNVLAQLMKPLTDSITQGAISASSLDPTHPMADIQTLGNGMLTAGTVGLAGLAAARSGSNLVNGIPVVGGMLGAIPQGILDTVVPLFWSALIACFACGALHAYILPMLPFLLWFYAMLAVASVAAELVIAAPLAAFMHMRADGQELINAEQRSIWLMGFNGFLRPSLLLLGLATSNLMMAVGATFLNRTYGTAVTATNGDSVIGIVGFIVLTVLVFYLHYQIVVRSMHLITAVPAVVASLLNATDQHRGEHNEAHQVFGAVGNITRSGVTTTARAVGEGLKPKPDDVGGTGANPDPGGGNGGGGSIRPASRPATGGPGGTR